MSTKWRSVVRFMGGAPEAENRPEEEVRLETVETPPVPTSPPPQQISALDQLGDENETLRSRISRIGDRLAEVAFLQQDFTALHESIASIILEHPQLQAQLSERDELLRRERENLSLLEREHRGLVGEHADVAEELARTTQQNAKLGEDLRNRDAELHRLRSELRERETLSGDLERQLSAEIERARVLTEENQSFRIEIQEGDKVVVRLERDLAEARDALNVLQNDHQTLRVLSEEQNERLAALSRSYTEIEQHLDTARGAAVELETKLYAEQIVSQKLEAERDADRTQLRTALASQEVKVEGLRSRIRVTENILEQAREQLSARGEQIKAAERALRDATLEKQAAERKLQMVQHELTRESLQVGEVEKARAMLGERCDMLSKAVAAKDNQLANADEKIVSLNRKLDLVISEAEGVRARLESRVRELSEELNSEKSERALALGALESARRTRADVERELHQMRKGLGEVRKLSEELNSERAQRSQVHVSQIVLGQQGSQATNSDNVRPFRSPE